MSNVRFVGLEVHAESRGRMGAKVVGLGTCISRRLRRANSCAS